MMRKLFVFMLTAILITSCSSKKILSVNKIAQNGIINNIASQYDFSQNRFSTFNNSKNSYVKNLPEVEVNIPTVKNNQNFLASRDKVKPSSLTTNYSFKELSHKIQLEKINNSYLEKVPIFEEKKSSVDKSNNKNQKNKILWIILSMFCFALTVFMYLWNLLLLAFEPIAGLALIPVSTLLAYLSFSSFKKISEGNSKQEYKKDRDGRNKEKNKSLKYALPTTLIFLLIALIFAAYS